MMSELSIIIPVYNRPTEVKELLYSLAKQDFRKSFEVIVVEDGSTETCEREIAAFPNLDIRYYVKENSGPGLSRNFGMERASGDYFIILDSDVILPTFYLSTVYDALKVNFTDAFGGPDAAHPEFSSLQKAINYSMTSFLTTGGIRGKKKGLGKFQPRSFNMGISKKAFQSTGGFSDMRTGEDIDLTFRLWQNGFDTQLIPDAYVYHKRRNNLQSFFKQTRSFGATRPILNRKYPSSRKLTYWFPALFIIGFDISLILLFFGYWQPILLFAIYFILIFLDALVQTKNFKVGFLSLVTTCLQLYGYGLGFLESLLIKK